MLERKWLPCLFLSVGLTACGGNSSSRNTDGEDAGDENSPSGSENSGEDDDDTDSPEPDAGAFDAGTAGPSPVDDDDEPVDAGSDDDDEQMNLPPQAFDAELETHEDTAIEFSLVGLDPDSDELSFEITEPEHGTLTISEESVRYLPGLDYVGDDVIEYTVSDGDLTSEVGTIVIQVLPVNDAPVATDDAFSVGEGDVLAPAGSLLDNDADVDGDELVVTTEPVEAPAFGILELNDDGTFSYEHTSEAGDEDSFTYEVCDPNDACDRGVVMISIELENDPPFAEDDEYNVTRGSTLALQAPGVQGNDGDPDDEELTTTVDEQPASGELTLNEDGSFSYAHDGSPGDEDSFTYELCDPEGACVIGAVTLHILDDTANNAPLAITDTYTVEQGGTLNATPSVLANDSDPEGTITLTPAPVTTTTNGALTFNADGTFTYVHDGSETNSDGFSYEICDDDGLCSIGAVNIIVTDTNQAPVAEDDQVEVDEGGMATGDVLSNDSDPDGDVLSVALLANVAHGSLNIGDNGEFTYVHDGSENLADGFEYEACDPGGLCDSAVVTISVGAVNEAPLANNDSYLGFEGTLYTSTTSLVANDIDPDGDPLTVNTTPVTPPAGMLTMQANGQFTYGPQPFEEEGSWVYEVCDPSGVCDQATATIVFQNLPPKAVSDSAFSCFGSTIVIPVANNDSDPGPDPFGVTRIVDPPSFGIAILNKDDTITYQPFVGVTAQQVAPPSQVTFTYEICDDERACAIGTVTVEIITDQTDPRCQQRG